MGCCCTKEDTNRFKPKSNSLKNTQNIDKSILNKEFNENQIQMTFPIEIPHSEHMIDLQDDIDSQKSTPILSDLHSDSYHSLSDLETVSNESFLNQNEMTKNIRSMTPRTRNIYLQLIKNHLIDNVNVYAYHINHDSIQIEYNPNSVENIYVNNDIVTQRRYTM